MVVTNSVSSSTGEEWLESCFSKAVADCRFVLGVDSTLTVVMLRSEETQRLCLNQHTYH